MGQRQGLPRPCRRRVCSMANISNSSGPNLANLRVLVVDDNRHMIAIVKAILQGFGVREITTVRECEDAVQIFNEMVPDIVILDFVMEPVDGAAIARSIRTSPTSANPFVPIIMLSAFASPARIGAARLAGVNEFLVKPVVPADLYKKLLTVIYQPRSFVRTQTYFGPDRRRHKKDEFHGDDRRKEQAELLDVPTDKTKKKIRALAASA